MLSHFQQYAAVCGSTLKSEMRQIGKLPRFFTPVGTQMAYVGNLLYGGMDQALKDNCGSHPICMGMTMPGRGLNDVYARLNAFSSRIVATDADSWDGSFPIVIANLVGHFRSFFVPREYRELHRRYYSQVYDGYVAVLGMIFHVPRQPSGQTLTTSDNSLVQSVLMFLSAIRCGMTLQQFQKEVLFYCMGDDLIYATKNDKFTAKHVADTYRSFGVYLECTTDTFHSIEQASFCGTTPVWRVVDG